MEIKLFSYDLIHVLVFAVELQLRLRNILSFNKLLSIMDSLSLCNC